MTKSPTNNPRNMINATINGTFQPQNCKDVARLRAKPSKRFQVRRVIMAKLKITQTRSTIGCLKNQIATMEALGLRKI